MFSKRHAIAGRTSVLALILVGLILGSGSSRAADGRDFDGNYQVASATVQPDGVQITFTVRVFNRGAEDVSQGTVKLSDSAVTDSSYGEFSSVNVAKDANVRLSGSFKISQREFDSWQQTEQGGGPRLWMEWTDSTGQPARQRIELTAAPVGEEN